MSSIKNGKGTLRKRMRVSGCCLLFTVALSFSASSAHERTTFGSWRFSGSAELALEFSHDGLRILEATARSFRVWDVQTRVPLTEPITSPAGGRFVTATLAPDGETVGTITGEHIVLWSSTTGRVTEKIPREGAASLAFAPTSRLMLAWADGDVVTVYRVGRADQPARLVHRGRRVLYARFLPNDRVFTRAMGAADDEEEAVADYVWDAMTGREIVRRSVPDPRIPPTFRKGQMAFSHDGNRVLTVEFWVVAVWDAQTGKDLWRVDAAGQKDWDIHAVGFGADADEFLTAGEEGISVWKVGRRTSFDAKWIHMVQNAWVSNGSKKVFVATSTEDNGVWSTEDWKHLLPIQPRKPGDVPLVAFTPQGDYVAVGYPREGNVEVYRLGGP